MSEEAYAAGALASRAARSGQMLAPERIDDLGAALLLLARELWVTRDRQFVLEEVLEAKGIAVAEAVRDHRPSVALAERLRAERERFTESLMTTLCPPVES